MPTNQLGHRRCIRLALVPIALALIWVVVPHTLATNRLDPTIPTITPRYTIPPRPTNTPYPPGPTSTAVPPEPTASQPARTATPPGDTPLPPEVTGSPPPQTPVTPAATAPARKPSAALTCRSQVSRTDLLPGEAVQYDILVTNNSTGPASSVVLQGSIGAGIDIYRVSATQGVAEVQDGQVLLRLGIIEPDQSVLAVLELRARLSIGAGEVFVLQTNTFFDGGQTVCSAAVLGTQPDHLPPTGADRRRP